MLAVMLAAPLALALLAPAPLTPAPRAPAPFADVLVVDAAGGPGSTHAAIQPAVDAASEGDVILVRGLGGGSFSGFQSYAGFTVASKSLTIARDVPPGEPPDAVEVRAPVVVQDLAAGQRVTLRGLRLAANNTPATELAALRIQGCAGSVWVEDCVATVRSWIGAPDAIVVDASTAVVLSAVQAIGSSPGSLLPFTAPRTSGLRVAASAVFAYGCAFLGGNGKNAAINPASTPATAGAPAVVVEAGALLVLDGCGALGGAGGTGALPPAGGCLSSQSGGAGVRQNDGLSFVHLRDCAIQGGPAGFQLGPPCAQAVAGPPLSNVASAPLEGDARSARSKELVRPTEAITIAFEGQENDLAFVVASPVPGMFFLEQGGLAVPPQFLVQFVGAVPSGGTLLATLGTHAPPPSFTGRTLFLQGAVAFFPGPNLVLANPTAPVLLGAGF